MIEISVASLRQLIELIDKHKSEQPFKLRMEETEVVGIQASLVTLYFDSQRDGTYTHSYLVNLYGAIKLD